MTAAARPVPGRLSELRASARRRAISPGLLLPVVLAIATAGGVGLVAVGLFAAWPPLGYVFTGGVLLAVAGTVAWLNGGDR